MKRQRVACLMMAAACAAVALPAGAQGLPAKTVQIVVPNPPGGGPDFIARLIAPRLAEALRQSVVVENRSGVNGVVGTEYAARGPADGSMIAFGNAGTHAINATLYRKLPYDPLRDFSAISEIANAPLVIVSHPQVPARTVKDVVALARKWPGKLNIAIPGATAEVAANALKLQAKVNIQNIPYKGGGPATIAVVSGESDLTLTNYTAIAGHAKAGKLRILGVTTARRSAQIPEVPTVAEGGLDGYDFSLWYGLFVPARTPAPVVQALYREVSRIVAMPEVNERLVATGHNVVSSTPEQFADKVRRETEKYRRIILDSGMRLE